MNGGDELVIVEAIDGGAGWHVRLAAGKGNVLDARLTAALTGVFERAAAAAGLKAICLDSQGPHFSFGASVQEHLPADVHQMLARFHGLIRAMLESGVPVLAAVRGQCLGGGLELVSVCHRVFASPDARLGQPEIALGVFAPVASLVLGDRIGRAAAEDLCLSGRLVPADEALRLGLVDVLVDDPSAAALQYARTHLFPRSASSLRFAVRALRHGLAQRLSVDLPSIERLYLDDLMATSDAVEGLQAFLEKRSPVWRNA
jgi:cyclohexa-1,5-dienecarbonyl-CoA hydratase